MIINVIIIDDEEKARENLKKILEAYFPEINILAMCGDVMEARKEITEKNPDLIFIDINMPVISGIEFLDSIPNKTFLSIIISAYDNHGINALKAGAIDYLLKPIIFLDLEKAINKVKATLQTMQLNASDKKIAITSANEISYHKPEDIVVLSGDDNYTKVFLQNGKELLVSRTLKHFEEKLPKNMFFRLQKSHIINLSHIVKYNRNDGGSVLLSNGKEYEIPKNKLALFLSYMKNHSI